MTTFNVALTPAPTTPVNLRLDVFYAPRHITPPFVAFRAYPGHAIGVYHIAAYDAEGNQETVYTGHLYQTYVRLARHLRMDVPYDDGGGPFRVKT